MLLLTFRTVFGSDVYPVVQCKPAGLPPIGSMVECSFRKHVLLENIKGPFWTTASGLALPSVNHLDLAFLNDPLKIHRT